MVRAHPDPPVRGWVLGDRTDGGVAQLGEHLLCKQGVIGSIPFTSTRMALGVGVWRRQNPGYRGGCGALCSGLFEQKQYRLFFNN
jgi:hypothetical protein